MPGDLDYFNLGTVTAGQSIFLTPRVPASSGLDPVVAVYDANNGYMVETNGRPFDGVAQVDISKDGTYYAVMRGGNATRSCCRFRWSRSIIPTTTPARKPC